MIGIFIPFRNRKKHLDILLEKLSKYPNISIHVLEQSNNDLFNRGKLFNIGFKEFADKYNYFIFHDVDLIPQDEDYNYQPVIPTHYSCFCEQFNYRLFDVDKSNYLKSKMFGGVIGIKKSDFIKCNGYSNLYEGWGCEDNDLLDRVLKTIGKLSRQPWTYNSLPHDSSYDSKLNPNLYNNLNYLKSDYDFKLDGLNKLVKTNTDNFTSCYEYTFDSQKIGPNVFFHKINFDCYYRKKDIITIYINELTQPIIKTIINFAYSEKKSVLITSSENTIPLDLKYFYCKTTNSYILKTYKLENNKPIESWISPSSYKPISTVNGMISYLIYWTDLEKVIYNNYNYLSVEYQEENIITHLSFDKFNIQTNQFEKLEFTTPIISKCKLSSEYYNIINTRTKNSFNYYIYYILNEDLQKILGLYETSLTNHYISQGINESRCVFNDVPEDFDALNYYQLNLDLKFIGLNIINLTKHYLTNGKNEKREYLIDFPFKIKNIDWDYFKFLYPDLGENTIDYWLTNKLELQTPLLEYTITSSINNHSNHHTCTLILTHPGGGGVEKYLDFLKTLFPNNIVLRPNCDKKYIYQLEIGKNIQYFNEFELDEIVNIILTYNINKIVVNHFSYFTPQIFQMCAQIKDLFNIKIISIIHDYSFFSYKSNLSCEELKKLYYNLCNPYYITRYTFLKHIDTLIFPSEYLKNVFMSFTTIHSSIKLIKAYHCDITNVPNKIITNIDSSDEFKIVIIGYNKGCEEIKSFLSNCTNTKIKLITLGKMDLSHPNIFPYCLEYKDSDVKTILQTIKPNLIWFPSKIPETYCYALSHLIMLGYPIVTYNIGAFTERLITRPCTWLLNLTDNLENKIDEIIDYLIMADKNSLLLDSLNYSSNYKQLICDEKDYVNFFV